MSHSPSRPIIDVQSQRSEHRRSEPLIFIGVQSHYFLELAFRAYD